MKKEVEAWFTFFSIQRTKRSSKNKTFEIFPNVDYDFW